MLLEKRGGDSPRGVEGCELFAVVRSSGSVCSGADDEGVAVVTGVAVVVLLVSLSGSCRCGWAAAAPEAPAPSGFASVIRWSGLGGDKDARSVGAVVVLILVPLSVLPDAFSAGLAILIFVAGGAFAALFDGDADCDGGVAAVVVFAPADAFTAASRDMIGDTGLSPTPGACSLGPVTPESSAVVLFSSTKLSGVSVLWSSAGLLSNAANGVEGLAVVAGVGTGSGRSGFGLSTSAAGFVLVSVMVSPAAASGADAGECAWSCATISCFSLPSISDCPFPVWSGPMRIVI